MLAGLPPLLLLLPPCQSVDSGSSQAGWERKEGWGLGMPGWEKNVQAKLGPNVADLACIIWFVLSLFFILKTYSVTAVRCDSQANPVTHL